MNTEKDEFARQLPFSLEAEQSVLGSILIDPECFNEIVNIITSDDFYLDEHKQIYLAMQDLYLQNRTIDVITLIDALVRRGVYESDENGRRYIKLIADIVPGSSNVADYAGIVRSKSLLRKIIKTCQEISDTAYAEQDEVAHIIDYAEQSMFSIAEGTHNTGFVHIRDTMLQVFDHLKLLKTDKEKAIGMPTGFSDLDKVLVGMGEGDLILVGARPGMGKTSFAMNIATNVARLQKKSVCVFSLEMSASQLVSRMISSEARVDSYNIRKGTLSNEEWENIAKASSLLSECDILIDDTTGITVSGMRSKLRRVKNLGLVVIDYLQLMQSEKHIESRVNEVADISRNLKLLAKDLKVPVICCAQLSRGPESRDNKRPMLSDLRDSGAIEQDADIVLFLYRDDYYKDPEDKQNTAEIIVAKNRHGALMNVKMGWLAQFTKFITLTDRDESQ